MPDSHDKDSMVFSVYFPKALVSRIDAIAKGLERSRNWVICKAVKLFMQAQDGIGEDEES